MHVGNCTFVILANFLPLLCTFNDSFVKREDGNVSGFSA